MRARRCRADSISTPLRRLPIARPFACSYKWAHAWSSLPKSTFSARITTTSSCVSFSTADQARTEVGSASAERGTAQRSVDHHLDKSQRRVVGGCREQAARGCLPTAFLTSPSPISVLSSFVVRKEMVEGGRT